MESNKNARSSTLMSGYQSSECRLSNPMLADLGESGTAEHPDRCDARVNYMDGGGRGIRTPVRVTPQTVFKTAGFNHSPIPPNTILPDLCLCNGRDSQITSSPCGPDSKSGQKVSGAMKIFPPTRKTCFVACLRRNSYRRTALQLSHTMH